MKKSEEKISLLGFPIKGRTKKHKLLCYTHFIANLNLERKKSPTYLIEDQGRPDTRDERMEEGSGHILPLPLLLEGLGGALRHQEARQEVGEGEGEESQEDDQPAVQPLLCFPHLHG